MTWQVACPEATALYGSRGLLESGHASPSSSSPGSRRIAASTALAIAADASGTSNAPAIAAGHQPAQSFPQSRLNLDLCFQIRRYLNPADLKRLVMVSRTLHTMFQPFLDADKKLLKFAHAAQQVNTLEQLHSLLARMSGLTPLQQRRPMLILAGRRYLVPGRQQAMYWTLMQAQVKRGGSTLACVETALNGGAPKYAVLQLVLGGMSLNDAMIACALDNPNDWRELSFAVDARDLVTEHARSQGGGKAAAG